MGPIGRRTVPPNWSIWTVLFPGPYFTVADHTVPYRTKVWSPFLLIRRTGTSLYTTHTCSSHHTFIHATGAQHKVHHTYMPLVCIKARNRTKETLSRVRFFHLDYVLHFIAHHHPPELPHTSRTLRPQEAALGTW